MCYGADVPVVKLEDVPHWRALGELPDDIAKLQKEKSWLLNGFFYNFYSDVPTTEQLKTAQRQMADEGVCQIIVPCVRQSDRQHNLIEQGFVSVHASYESIYYIEGDVNTDLRLRVGSKQMRNLKRLAERASQRFTPEYYVGDLRQKNAVVNEISELFKNHCNKYQTTVNFFSLSILKYLFKSEIGDKFIVFLYRDPRSSRLVSAMLGFIDARDLSLWCMIYSSDRDLVEKGQNLYVASFYNMFHLARELGLNSVNLGRGPVEMKKKLGANVFIEQHHWINDNGLKGLS